jgi:hypothetical protein
MMNATYRGITIPVSGLKVEHEAPRPDIRMGEIRPRRFIRGRTDLSCTLTMHRKDADEAFLENFDVGSADIFLVLSSIVEKELKTREMVFKNAYVTYNGPQNKHEINGMVKVWFVCDGATQAEYKHSKKKQRMRRGW